MKSPTGISGDTVSGRGASLHATTKRKILLTKEGDKIMKVLQCQKCKNEGIPLLRPTCDDLRRHCLCGNSWLPEEDVLIDRKESNFKNIKISKEDFQKMYGWTVGK